MVVATRYQHCALLCLCYRLLSFTTTDVVLLSAVAPCVTQQSAHLGRSVYSFLAMTHNSVFGRCTTWREPRAPFDACAARFSQGTRISCQRATSRGIKDANLYGSLRIFTPEIFPVFNSKYTLPFPQISRQKPNSIFGSWRTERIILLKRRSESNYVEP